MPIPIRVLMVSIIAMAVAGTVGADVPVNTDVFVLEQDGRDYRLVDQAAPGRITARIPRQWLDYDGLTEEDEACRDEPPVFSKAVTAFAVSDRLTGLHLSSYRAPGPGDGSMQLACGQDVFLLLEGVDDEVKPTGFFPGVSKTRAGALCSTARSTRFRIADIDGDGSIDIGVTVESVNCKAKASADGERDEFERVHATSPVRWHLFDGDGWMADRRFDGNGADRGRLLPLIGIDKTPVDVVNGQEKPAALSPVETCRVRCDAARTAACKNQQGVLETLCRRRADTDVRQCRLECTMGWRAGGGRPGPAAYPRRPLPPAAGGRR